MARHYWQTWHAPAGVLALAAVLFFGRLDAALLEPEDVRFAEIARQMHAEGRWLVPGVHGELFLDKPPLLYWVMMPAYALLGNADWVARLVAGLAGWLTVLVGYGWARAAAGRRAALFAALALTLSGEFVYRARMVTTNGLLALGVTAALAAGHLALMRGRHRGLWAALAGAACGLGVLAKGPVAVVLVAGPLLVGPLLDRRLRHLGWHGWAAFAAAGLLAAGPWFVAVSLTVPGFLEYFFWLHHVKRFTDPFDHAEPVWFYLPYVALGLLPWPLALVSAWRGGGWRGRWSLQPLALVAGGWGVLFFSLAGCKRACYLLPALVPLSVGLGCALAGAWPRLGGAERKAWRWGAGVSAAVMVGGVFAWLPAYAERYSLRALVLAHAAEAGRADAVASYPRRWDAVSFYLGRQDVRAYRPDERAGMASDLAGRGSTFVFVKTQFLGEWRAALPAGAEFTPAGRNGWVTTGVVRARQ